MSTNRWQVRLTPAELPDVSDSIGVVAGSRDGWGEWLRRSQVVPGTPFLLSPTFEYDVALNGFFQSVEMVTDARSTQVGYALDLAAFLTFLWSARQQRSWRDATEADHLAYLYWRRRDPEGPQVSGAAWNREVAAVNRFYRWAVQRGHVRVSPVPQTWRRPLPPDVGGNRRASDELRPATYAHDAVRDRVQWLPPPEYRLWRDVGVRGFSPDGLPRGTFRGRWGARNATFCDLMVRTGLRVSEQAALTVLEVPSDSGSAGYQRFWLSAAIAKGGSARWVYVPPSVINDLNAYVAIDRPAVVAAAREQDRYRRIRRPLVIEDPGRHVATEVTAQGVSRTVKLTNLTASERRRLLVERPDGVEPAALWLGEHGWPLSADAWKKMFADANDRCSAVGVPLAAHAHMLRHTFAVVTLEQLQRGHLAALAEMSPDQRGHYTRIFGDPLDWVRRRLGHRSVVTTQIYLHALAELEMHTRMALVPDGWDDPPTALSEQPPGDSEVRDSPVVIL